MKFVILIALIALALSDSTLTINCGTCSSISGSQCARLSGDGFDSNKEYALSQSCSSISPNFPATYTFTCESDCTEGCQITSNQLPGAVVCSQTFQGKAIISTLNILYSANQGEIAEKDWCNCGGLSAGAIVGIVIGSLVALAIIIGIIIYCYTKQSNLENTRSRVNTYE